MEKTNNTLENLVRKHALRIDVSKAVTDVQHEISELLEILHIKPNAANYLSTYRDAEKVLQAIHTEIVNSGMTVFDYKLENLLQSSLLRNVPESKKEEVAKDVVSFLVGEIADTVLTYINEYPIGAKEAFNDPENSKDDIDEALDSLEEQASKELGLKK